ncbi:MAG TPA: pentapeptide repeat-containing protein [Candidatus Cybelea sp.]
MIVVAATVLNALWQDALLVLCVWLLLRAWPSINAATRYVVWSATLMAALVVPVATTLAFFTPAQPVATTAGGQGHATSVTGAHERTAVTPSRPIQHSAMPAPQMPSLTRVLPVLPPRLHVTLPLPVGIAVFAAWLLLAAYALIGLLIGLLRLEQLKRDALPLPIEYRDSMPQWVEANKGRRPVRLCVSEAIDVPVAVGLFDAMILIPQALLDRLSPQEVEQISLHELAHLRRADDWSNCLQRLIVAALGWNPAALFVAQQLELEREVACDDWVLSSVHAVRPYALCLTKMAQTAAWPHHPMPAPGVFTTRKQISLRIERLLGTGRDIATNLAIGPATAAIASVGALALLIAFVAPSVAAPAYQVAQPAKPPTAAAHATVAKAAASSRPKIVAKTEIVRQPAIPSRASSLPAAPAPVQRQARENKYVAAAPLAPAGKPLPPSGAIPSGAIPSGAASAVDMGMNIASKSIADSSKMANGIDASVGSAIAKSLNGTAATHTLAQSSSGKSCVGCDFRGVNWAGRDLRGAHYTGTDFSSANLRGADLSNSDLSGVDFSSANLSGVSFRHARLAGCDFANANLTGADFTGATMTGCQFKNASLPSAVLRGILNSCKGCDFTRANLSGADLSGVRLNGDDFSRADLRNANFSGAELVGADFSRARLDGANFNGATLSGCDLSGVDLSHVDFSRAKLVGMDFTKQNTPR